MTLPVRKLGTVWERTKGLIGCGKPQSIIFNTRFGIHTFGLRFPIDILILDSQGTVVKIKKNMDRNRIFLWNPKYNVVIELPEGTIEGKKIKLGSEVIIKSR